MDTETIIRYSGGWTYQSDSFARNEVANTSWLLSFNTKKVLLDMATFFARISKERTRCYTTINLGSIRRWSATYQVGFDDNRYYWNGTNWGTIHTQQLSQCEMIASLIAPNIGQESRGYVVGIWRGHTNSITTWNCIYFIAKVDGWLQKYCMIPPPNLVYIQSSPHTTIHWLQLATSNQPNTIAFDIYAILMQISEVDIHFAFVIVLSKDWHNMCTPQLLVHI